MKHFLYLILLFITNCCVAQYDPKNIAAFDNKKVEVFHDDFTDNSWIDNSKDSCSVIKSLCEIDSDLSHIKDGFLYFNETAKIETIFKCYDRLINIDFEKNFELVIKAKILGSKDKNNVGVLYWGRSCKRVDGYNLYFGQNRSFRIFYSNEQFADSVHPDVDKTISTSKSYIPNDFNTFVVRKYNSKYYLFVNNHFVGTCPFVPLTGNILGIGKTVNNAGVFDYVSIYYLP